ncbi:hypothetical protein H2198_004453 [Neophaeococcomyces mojaviensis]|uniref:Uncharacterized protein n=1 Tax=Neophaeococcomyces mojaviensis TaxID=3383035 RepID=A0ACC3A8I7_9EURO|nr:hypothetical protein H2198_004453 [Knufia sp. JES_112]
MLSFLTSFALEKWKTRPGLDSLVVALETSLQLWLKALHQCDVDLDDYGKKENQFLQTNRKWHNKFKTEQDEFPQRKWIIRLVGFTYGPLPEEWKFYFATSTDELHHTRLLDHVIRRRSRINTLDPSLKVPGAWIDVQESQNFTMAQYFAQSKRKRKRFLRAMGVDQAAAAGYFLAPYCFHGYWYQPKKPQRRDNCNAKCPDWSCCKQDEIVDKDVLRRAQRRG